MPDEKRLFFGMEVSAPWPDFLPSGRHLDPNHRHMTLAFLGSTPWKKIEAALPLLPQPNFKVGFAAKFDQCLFLPPRHPHVVAWHLDWLEESQGLTDYRQSLIKFLDEHSFRPDTRREFMPHVTLARSPLNEKEWRENFIPLPAYVSNIHLYESTGNLHYEPIWTNRLLPPFLEMDHTADIAYLVYGKTFSQLYLHAFLALAFNFSPLLPYLEKRESLSQLEDVIIELNHMVGRADGEIGCPFKAISFHSHLEISDELMKWEMIIDV